MGTDGDILISHTPQVFGHSPSASFYNTCGGNCRLQNQATVPRQRLKSPNRATSRSMCTASSETKPSRPCLVVRPDDSSSSSDENEPQSPIRQKKKVVFADDRGLSLTQIRLMVESPVDLPTKVFSPLTQKPTTETVSTKLTGLWKITFSQPASNYLEFRKRLETGNVSLENVIIKSNENELTGTVKVKNISFEKSVTIRFTENDWIDYFDIDCSFVDKNTSNSITIIYDTFSFKLPMMTNKETVEFCVCFKSAKEEYWDNNDGKNYKIIKNNEQNAVKSKDDLPTIRSTVSNGSNNYLAPITRANTWPKYTSWNIGSLEFQSSAYW